MITTFNTAAPAAAAGGNSNTTKILLWIGGLAVAGFLFYKFAWPVIQKKMNPNDVKK